MWPEVGRVLTLMKTGEIGEIGEIAVIGVIAVIPLLIFACILNNLKGLRMACGLPWLTQ